MCWLPLPAHPHFQTHLLCISYFSHILGSRNWSCPFFVHLYSFFIIRLSPISVKILSFPTALWTACEQRPFHVESSIVTQEILRMSFYQNHVSSSSCVGYEKWRGALTLPPRKLFIVNITEWLGKNLWPYPWKTKGEVVPFAKSRNMNRYKLFSSWQVLKKELLTSFRSPGRG